MIRIYLSLVFAFIGSCLYLGAQDNIYSFAQVGSSANPTVIRNDSIGNIYAGGYFYEDEFSIAGKIIYGRSGGESSNLFVVKTNPNGNPIWMHSIYGVEDLESYPNLSLKTIENNNAGELVISFTVSGAKSVFIGNREIQLDILDYDNLLFAKISKEGFVLWVKKAVINSTNPYGNISDIKIDENGAVYILGQFSGESATFDGIEILGSSSGYRSFTAKYNPVGEIDWASTIGTSTIEGGTYIDIYPSKINIGNDGSIVICGQLYGDGDVLINGEPTQLNTTTNGFLIYYDNLGNEKWGKLYMGSNYDYAENVTSDNDGFVTVLGYSSSKDLPIDAKTFIASSGTDAFIVRYDNDGNFIWLKSINLQLAIEGSESVNALFGLDKSSNVYYSGKFYSDQLLGIANNHSSGPSDIFAAKFNASDGSTSWVFSAGSSEYENIQYGDIDEHGNITIGGYFSLDFNIGTYNLIVGSGSNYYFANILNTGKVSFAKRIVGTTKGTINVSDIARDYFGNISLIGEFNGDGLSLEDKPLSNTDNYGVFIAKYCQVASIEGKVSDANGDAVTEGIVKAFGCAFRQKAPISDSTEIHADGTFIFTDLPLGRYIIKVEPTNTGDKKYLPGYYPFSGSWENAGEVIITSSTDLTNLNVIIQGYNQLKGNNRLQGVVTKIDSNDVFKSTMKKPMSGGRASLARSKDKASDWDIIVTVDTDESGNFEFYSIPDGSYTILIDIPGLPSINPHSVSVSGGMFASNLDYYVTESEVQSIGTPNYSSLESYSEILELKIFPNPANKSFNLVLSDDDDFKTLSITNSQGREVYCTNEFKSSINVESLLKGLYFVKIQCSNKIFLIKLIKN